MQLSSLFSTTLLSGALALVVLTPEIDSEEVTTALSLEKSTQSTEVIMAQSNPPGERRRVRRRTRRRVRRREERRDAGMLQTQPTVSGDVYYWSGMNA